jgi:hypothetical protein
VFSGGFLYAAVLHTARLKLMQITICFLGDTITRLFCTPRGHFLNTTRLKPIDIGKTHMAIKYGIQITICFLGDTITRLFCTPRGQFLNTTRLNSEHYHAKTYQTQH